MRESIQWSLVLRYETMWLYIAIGAAYCIVIFVIQSVYTYIKSKRIANEQAFTKKVDELRYTESMEQYTHKTSPMIRKLLKEQTSYKQRRKIQNKSVQKKYPEIYQNIHRAYNKRETMHKIEAIAKNIITIVSLWTSTLVNKN